MAKYNDYTGGQVEAVINRMGSFETWLRFAGGAGRIVFGLLTHFRDWIAPAQPALTTSEEYFKEAGVVWMGDNFRTQFLGLEVGPAEAATLAVNRLEQNSLDTPILAELRDHAETVVSQFREFLSAHRESSEWFVFYLHGKDGNLWAVSARWRVGFGGWFVVANPVTIPSEWNAGRQVVSRK